MTTMEHPRSKEGTNNPALLDFPAAQEYLGGISRSTLKVLIWRGILSPTRIGRRVLFSKSLLDDYIAQHTVNGQREGPK